MPCTGNCQSEVVPEWAVHSKKKRKPRWASVERVFPRPDNPAPIRHRNRLPQPVRGVFRPKDRYYWVGGEGAAKVPPQPPKLSCSPGRVSFRLSGDFARHTREMNKSPRSREGSSVRAGLSRPPTCGEVRRSKRNDNAVRWSALPEASSFPRLGRYVLGNSRVWTGRAVWTVPSIEFRQYLFSA